MSQKTIKMFLVIGLLLTSFDIAHAVLGLDQATRKIACSSGALSVGQYNVLQQGGTNGYFVASVSDIVCRENVEQHHTGLCLDSNPQTMYTNLSWDNGLNKWICLSSIQGVGSFQDLTCHPGYTADAANILAGLTCQTPYTWHAPLLAMP